MTGTLKEIFVLVSVDGEREDVLGQTCVIEGKLTFMPFVCAEQSRAHKLMKIAEHIADEAGIKIKMLRFSTREEIEEYNGEA
jgi:hypothetical protein